MFNAHLVAILPGFFLEHFVHYFRGKTAERGIIDVQVCLSDLDLVI
jgi:hypothetical protein